MPEISRARSLYASMVLWLIKPALDLHALRVLKPEVSCCFDLESSAAVLSKQDLEAWLPSRSGPCASRPKPESQA